MKILIAYSTKTGTTEICARMLANELARHNVEIVNLGIDCPNISEYDIVIIGGDIRIGKLNKISRSFIEKNKYELSMKKSAYFICNGFNDESDNYFKKAFPAGIIENSIFHDSFGGELKLEKQKGIDKLLVKIMLKANEENDEFAMPNILTESINRFADKIKESIGYEK